MRQDLIGGRTEGELSPFVEPAFFLALSFWIGFEKFQPFAEHLHLSDP
jgi:hypothetical protein